MPYLPKEIQHWLNREIGSIDSFQTIGGGCINYTGSVITKNATFFIKWNSAKEFPQIFNKEAQGLKLLKQGLLRVPKVKNIYEGREFSCLLLENIEPQRRSTNYWHQLGEGLAVQHRITAQSHGLNIDNYMGSLPQYNQTSHNWIDFYIANRLTPQVQLAESKKLIDAEITKSFDRLYTRLSDLINNDPPSLLHGDLWNGNIMAD